MRKFILLNLLLLLLTIVPTAAQNKNYQLSDLSVEDYMRATSSVVNQLTDRYSNILLTISQEYNLRYGSVNLTDISLDSLIDFQTSIGIGVDISLVIDEREWFEAILELGIREVGSNALHSQFSIGNFNIVSTRVDFDDNNQDEYLLEIYDSFSGRQFYAFVGDDVQLLPIPIAGLYGDVVTRGIPISGQLSVVRNEDIDGDEGSEIIVEGGDYGYWASCGDLYVIDWQDGELVNRTGGMFHYCLPMAQVDTADIEIITTQSDTIQMIETRVDGWNCQHVRTDTLSLNANILHSNTIYAETSWCGLRDAANAFNLQDYEMAADTYMSIISEFDGQMAQYIYARLALSYALNNQLGDAQSILNNVEPTDQMGDLIIHLRAVSDQPDMMCRVTYEFFVDINATTEDAFSNPYSWTPANFYFGTEALDPRSYPLPEPSIAGCDYQQVLRIEPTPVPTSSTSLPDIHGFARYTIYLNLIHEEYENTLTQIDRFLESDEHEDYSSYIQPLQYWRALTLELMGREDEALVEYIAIYEAAPDSTWGMLAALHFEEVD